VRSFSFAPSDAPIRTWGNHGLNLAPAHQLSQYICDLP
jgi:hypothetical protein